MDEIPTQLIFNWDQTGIRIAPWTMDEKGKKMFEIAGISNRRQISVVKWTDSVHDARMFSQSRLNELLKNEVIPPCQRRICDEDIPIFIIGDPAYPLMPYIMKEYAGGGMKRQEQYFDFRLCSTRNVTECAFGRLKARFACLKHTMDKNMDDLPFITYACFVVHNYCE
ncbi:PREDICTED: protein ALP1-like [Amphimedon queenslandica]|uniref:DDE Tnp4 domain-containing protein n=1 Tax=Amphimedon queenslandica TaxID=400682 RepID=A0AAN0INS8_AMPQE|nr:PREDICTED: protein ALP1-like [Amphimedon queenslandica]|eukprot:XP_011405215.1 PREDICTED: protein ALP1-like [Amphimedon queenslandica]